MGQVNLDRWECCRLISSCNREADSLSVRAVFSIMYQSSDSVQPAVTKHRGFNILLSVNRTYFKKCLQFKTKKHTTGGIPRCSLTLKLLPGSVLIDGRADGVHCCHRPSSSHSASQQHSQSGAAAGGYKFQEHDDGCHPTMISKCAGPAMGYNLWHVIPDFQLQASDPASRNTPFTIL
jgi:hypothetical protein